MAVVKPAELIFISVMLLHGLVAAFNCSSPTPAALFTELENNLFSKKLVPPVQSFQKPLNVTISITLVGVLGVDEKSQTLSSVLWEVLEWDIDGLSWDEEECGASRVSIPRDNLWVPDIHITEFVDDNNFPITPYVYLSNTGHVFDDKPIRVVSSCPLGIYTFPFDVQNCTLTFGSYLHVATDIRMIQGASAQVILGESRKVMETNGEWELADIGIAHSTLALDGGNFSEIKYFIVLRRRPTMYVVNLLIPSCFLLALDLFSFILPPASVDRSSFKMTLILGYTVFLLIMNDLLPITGEETPLLNVFFSISLALMVASLLETVFITNIQFSSGEYSAVPHWLRVFVLHYVAVVVCLPPKKKSNRVTVHISPACKEPVRNTNTTNLSVSEGIYNDTPAVKPPTTPLVLQPRSSPVDPALDELRRLSRDLTSIRLQVDKYFQGSKTSQEWHMIGEVIDRLLFYLYLFFIIASLVTISGIWAWNNSYVKS